MQGNIFKPEKSLEMDIMKSILSDYSKFKQFYSIFGRQNNFWISTMNYDLFRFIKQVHEQSGKPERVNELTFYDWIFENFQLKFPQYDMEIYEDFYQNGFDFELALEHYAEYFKRIEIIILLESLTEIFKSANEIDFSDVHLRLKTNQANTKKSEFWPMENEVKTERNSLNYGKNDRNRFAWTIKEIAS